MMNKYPEIESKTWTKEKIKNEMSREVIKIFFSTNFKSTAARTRYLKATLRFIEYISEHTNVHFIDNIKFYHLKEYIAFLLKKEKGKEKKIKENYINTEINGVLYYLNLKKINNPKYKKGAQFLINEVKKENEI